jgi:phosphopantetheinyl transferase
MVLYGEIMKLYCKIRGNLNQSADAAALLELAYYRNYNGKMPKITKTPNGKPYFHDRSDIHFSLSHSKTHVLCAISSSPVGADIESERTISERTKSFFCSSEELLHFEPLELWVLKESYVKLFGNTIADIKKLRFTRKNGSIITPDSSVKSCLFRVESCYIAVSTYGGRLPEEVYLIRNSEFGIRN